MSDVIICEHSSAYITCPGRSRIKVTSAIYGRTQDGQICPHHAIKTTHCESSSSDSKVKSMCNTRSRCLVKANNGEFGDPCEGTFKYLEIKYKCV